MTDEATLSIFITGATSAIGLVAIRALSANGYKVYGIAPGVDGATAIRKAGGLPVFADMYRASEIKSAFKMAKTDVVIHLAPQVANTVPYRAQDWEPQLLTESTASVIEAAKDAAVRFIIHTSYAFLYAPSDAPIGEQSSLVSGRDNPLLSAAIKAEKAVLRCGLPTCVLRVGYVYGPEMPEIVALAEALRAGKSVLSGEQAANWIHADDLVQALILAIQQQPAEQIFNIVDDEPSSPTAFLATFAAAMGLKAPGRMPGFLGRAFGGKYTADLIRRSSQASNGKAKTELGWKPKYSTAIRGIEQTLMMWRAGAALKS